jgi:PhnB protein
MAKAVNTYLIFNGNCEEAFQFYKSVFGGEFQYIGKYKDAPEEEGGEALSEEDSNRIMHVSLPIGSSVLMGSDSHPKFGDVGFGDNFSI